MLRPRKSSAGHVAAYSPQTLQTVTLSTPGTQHRWRPVIQEKPVSITHGKSPPQRPPWSESVFRQAFFLAVLTGLWSQPSSAHPPPSSQTPSLPASVQLICVMELAMMTSILRWLVWSQHNLQQGVLGGAQQLPPQRGSRWKDGLSVISVGLFFQVRFYLYISFLFLKDIW